MGNFLMGLTSCLIPTNLLALLGGTILGIAFGATPGLSTTMALVVLIPVTYGMDAVTGLVMMAGAYVGGVYGGSISAILINTPGTPSATATALDGHPMARAGRGQEALTESAVASFWGTVIGFVALMTIAPQLARFSLKFASQESVWLALFGLSVIASLASKSLLRGCIGACIGFMLGCVGTDPQYGYVRYAFGDYHLFSGLASVPMIIGIFSVTSLINLVIEDYQRVKAAKMGEKQEILKTGKYKITLKDLCMYPLTYLWCSIVGVVVGIIPACGTSIAAFLGYNESKRLSKHPELFGTGVREGISGCESANNAVIGGSLIPMMTLGIPGNAVSMVLMGSLMLHGLTPGNDLFTTKAHITYPFMVAILIASFVMMLLGIAFAPQFAKVNNIPNYWLATGIVILITIGSFSCTNNYFDIFVMLFFGVLGYFAKRMQIDTTAILLGAVLGPMAEKGLMRSIALCGSLSGAAASMFQRPVCVVLMALTVASLCAPLFSKLKKGKSQGAKAE